MIRARKRTCIRNFPCEPTDGQRILVEVFQLYFFFLFSGLFACFPRRNYYYYRLFLYRNLSVQVFIVFFTLHRKTSFVTYFRDSLSHIFVTTLFCIFSPLQNVFAMSQIRGSCGHVKPPGTTMQHVSHVLVAVLRPGVQLARSGLVRFGL